MFVSFDDGGNRQTLQNNLPEVPITDLRVRRQDLVVATQGRALWILDDLTPLHQISDEVTKADYYLYKPGDRYAPLSGAFSLNGDQGKNPPSGAQITYVINKTLDGNVPMSMEILDHSGTVIYSESTGTTSSECDAFIRKQLKRTTGAHIWHWNMRVGMFDCIKELTMTNRNLSAYDAAPGQYSARLKIGSFSQTQSFEIKIDPRIEGSLPDVAAAYAERDRLSASVLIGATEMAQGVRELRKVKRQLDFILEETTSGELMKKGQELDKIMDDWIAKILQKELRTQQNNYQFEARLLVKFKSFLNEMGDGNVPVTQGMRDVTRDYLNEWNKVKTELEAIKKRQIRDFNTLLRGQRLPEVILR